MYSLHLLCRSHHTTAWCVCREHSKRIYYYSVCRQNANLESAFGVGYSTLYTLHFTVRHNVPHTEYTRCARCRCHENPRVRRKSVSCPRQAIRYMASKACACKQIQMPCSETTPICIYTMMEQMPEKNIQPAHIDIFRQLQPTHPRSRWHNGILPLRHPQYSTTQRVCNTHFRHISINACVRPLSSLRSQDGELWVLPIHIAYCF